MHLFPVVEHHDVVVDEIVLAEVGTLLRGVEVSGVVGETEESCELHVIRRSVVIALTPQRLPKPLRFITLHDPPQRHRCLVLLLLPLLNLLQKSKIKEIGHKNRLLVTPTLSSHPNYSFS